MQAGRNLPDVVKLEAIADHFGFSPGLFMIEGGVDGTIDPVTREVRQDYGKKSVIAKTYTAPLYDAIGASCLPGEAIVNERVPVPQQVIEQHPDAFFLRVTDDRMNRVLPSGVYALVDPGSEPINGDIAAVVVGDDQARIARFHRLTSSVVLQPDSLDPNHKDEIHDTSTGLNIIVLGRVVWFGPPPGARL